MANRWREFLTIFGCFGVLLTMCGCGAVHDELIICGGREVAILELDAGLEAGYRKVWSWTADGDEALPVALKGRFDSTDDCKGSGDGKWVLVTSSGGAVALVERETGQAVFWARCVNAHSAEFLPGGRIIVALSTGERGNALELYDKSTLMRPLWRDELFSGHGVVWDGDRQLLWALGYDELRVYGLVGWETQEPSLEKKQTFKLPDPGGHDLQAVPDGDDLVLTTGGSVWLFDRDKGTFRGHPELAGRENVKSVMVHLVTKQTVYIQAEESWWAYNIRFLNPAETLRFQDRRLYKARWNSRIE